MTLNQIFLTRECKRKCEFCFAKEINKKKDYVTLQDYKKYIEFLKTKTQYKRIHLLGGEPLLNPNIKEIIEETTKNNFKITISTSGLENIKKIKKLLNPKIEFSFTYPTDNKNKEEIFENLKILQKKRIKVITSIVIKDKNFNKEEIIETINNNNIKDVIITPPLPNYEHNNLFLETFTKDYSNKIYELINFSISNKINVRQDCSMPACIFEKTDSIKLIKKGFNFGKCTIKLGKENGIFVGPNLDIYVCPIFERPIGNIKKHNLQEILERKKRIEKELLFQFNKKCQNCLLYKKNICIPCAAYKSIDNKNKINELLHKLK